MTRRDVAAAASGRTYCFKASLNERVRKDNDIRAVSIISPVAPNLDSGVQIDDIFAAMGLPRRVVATVPHYTALPGLVRGTDLVAHTRRRLVNLLRTAANLVVFPIPAPFRVPELLFEQIWHPRYERDAGHRWLRDLVLDTVAAKRST